ncbi:NfeD family protein [Cloacibacillus sp. An23]|uniref:NfeD family protein n=1 Tax=Cloacibacillus sp. An23 TaxID=1965591 RepID=UPI000B39BFC3|nr:NfeD family protein [Cloacibacillus sp. An23]OUO94976.1 hypothetical protein B5F39_00110 [Cloacibacillus sp. An23]
MDGLASLITSNPVVFWLIVAILAGVIEASTAGLFSVWFAIGALVTMLPAWLGVSFNAQIAVFIAASALALVFTRPFFKRVLRVANTPTNADMLIGEKAAVTAEIDNIAEHGRVLAGGLDWEARSADGSKIEKGAIVKILELRGVTLIVEKTTKEKQEEK